MEQTTNDSELVSKGACDECGSSDGNALYTDGHTYCFVCNTHKKGEGAAPQGTGDTGKRPRALAQGEVRALPAREITEETCKKWGYLVGEVPHPKTKKPERCQIAQYRDETGRVVAQKLRWADKTFQTVGDFKSAGLYGQWMWRDGGRRVVVVEGEIDALSVSQLQDHKWPVVSIPNGAPAAKKTLVHHLEWLLKFDEIVLLFDDDKVGQEAAAECAPLFPVGRCKIATINGFKDANDALKAREGSRVIDAIWQAKAYRPDGIVTIADCLAQAVMPVEMSTRAWPWQGLTEKTYGRRFGEVYGFAGGTGMGKTTVFKQVQAHILQNEQAPIALFHLEEPTHHTAKTLAGVIDGVRYHVPGVDYDVQQLHDTLVRYQDRVFLYDHFGGATYETIVEKIRYLRHAHGVRDFFLDHLTALAAVMDAQDERKAIDKMMAELSALMIELDSNLYFISHLTTPEGKSHEEGGRVLEKHLRGSRSIVYWSHFVFAVEGNKQEPGSPRILRVLKDRYTGDSNGLCVGLMYQQATGRMTECSLDDDSGEGRSHGFRDETDTIPF